jgi:hypothetical protein
VFKLLTLPRPHFQPAASQAHSHSLFAITRSICYPAIVKRLNLGLLLFFSIVWAAKSEGPKTPMFFAKVTLPRQETDSDAKASLPLGLSKHVWIAVRTGGTRGRGTAKDPLDGSSQVKLDAIFKSYYEAGTRNIQFHLAPGRYHMIGGRQGWVMLTGWKIEGAGIDLTTVVQDFPAIRPDPSNWYPLWHGRDDAGGNNGMVIRNMTIDLGYLRYHLANPKFNFLAVLLTGGNSLIENIKAINAGGNSAIAEPCVLNIQSAQTAPPISNTHIRNCQVYAVTDVTGWNLNNIPSLNYPIEYGTNASYENNYIEFNGARGIVQIAPAGFNGAISINNTIKNGRMYTDTFPCLNTLVSNNKLINGSIDMQSAPGNSPPGFTNTIISNNRISVKSDPGINVAGAAKNTVIKGNAITSFDGSAHTAIAINGTIEVKNTTVQDNVIDPVLRTTEINAPAHTSYQNNRTPDGSDWTPDRSMFRSVIKPKKAR